MSFDELYEIFYDLFADYKKINKKRKELKIKNQSLTKQIKLISKEKKIR